MQVPFLDLKAQYQSIKHEIDPAMQSVCADAAFVLGKYVYEFEKNFAKYCQAADCVAVDTGTTALHLAMLALDIGVGDQPCVGPDPAQSTAIGSSPVGKPPLAPYHAPRRPGHAGARGVFMRRFLAASLAALSLTACAAQNHPPLAATPASLPAAAPAPVPLADLVKAVDIPYESFTLPNGLTTIVHTDRKAPIVGVTLYYRVGSKNEPRGKTGFAHLYEHLFFGGSENVPRRSVRSEVILSCVSSIVPEFVTFTETVLTYRLPKRRI